MRMRIDSRGLTMEQVAEFMGGAVDNNAAEAGRALERAAAMLMGRECPPALETYLRPLAPFLNDPTMTDLLVNEPGAVWVENADGFNRHPVAALDYEHLIGLCELAADYNRQTISEESPLLSGHLPGGFRVQCVIPPAVADGRAALAIRKHRLLELTPGAYVESGAFQNTNDDTRAEQDQRLERLYADGRWPEFLALAIRSRKNLLISGGTGTGKTTFLNAHLQHADAAERIVTIEDAAELRLPHENSLSLFYPRDGAAGGPKAAQRLLETALRLRPDRVILGELRGAEAFSFLRAVNTGHPGSMTSLHADSPRLALQQLALMVMQADTGLTRSEVIEYVESLVDVIVQLRREPNGRRGVSEIYYRAC